MITKFNDSDSSYLFGSMFFSGREIRDILRSWLLVSVAFTIALVGFSLDAEFYAAFVMIALTAGLGFLLHELSHKYVAQKFGCRAEYRAFDWLLWLSVLMSFLGFVFAAPGAVFIHGHISRKENGIISLAGPLMNIVIAILFLLLFLVLPMTIFEFGFGINAWLALFNLLPIGNFDGAKVLAWNKGVFFVFIAGSSILVGISAII